jgi:hypothetical protein
MQLQSTKKLTKMIAINTIQFYADKENEYKNKPFCFQVADRTEAFKVLLHFRCHKNTFRAIYYNTKVQTGNSTARFSDELIAEYNFFNDYDCSHFPSLEEAQRDYEIWKIN